MAGRKKTTAKKAQTVSASKVNTSEKKRNSLKTLLYERKNKRLLLLLIILALVGAGLYFGKSLFVAAMVGGKPISRIQIVKELEKQGGKQMLDALVTKQLISQEARKQSINVSDDQVKEEVDKINKQVETQGTTLDAALALQGQTRESLEENIRIQKTVEALLKNEVEVNEEDMKKYFEENKALYGENAKYEDLKDEVKAQLTQQKLSEAFQTWIEKLKNDANIIYFVNY